MAQDGLCLPEGAQRVKQPQHHQDEKTEIWGSAAAVVWSQRGFWLSLTSHQLQAAPAAPQALAAVLLRAPAAFTCASTLR